MLRYFFCLLMILTLTSCAQTNSTESRNSIVDTEITKKDSLPTIETSKSTFDTASYEKLLEYISNGDSSGRWPVKTDYPTEGAVLPFNRIVAYYGNLYSKRMGILGEFPKKEVLAKLKNEVDKWTKADSVTPAIPALHYIAVTAQEEPGPAKAYRLRMPFHQIDTIIKWAKEINALVFIDIQVGLSSIKNELQEFEKYLAMPQVHFGLDPEFSMKHGDRPGSVVGTVDAEDINYVTNYLAGIAKKYNTPPKIFILHRFTRGMVTNYKKIKLHPQVQVVVDMDGWGAPDKKIYAYNNFIYTEPVQFTGFKIFYKNDTKKVGQTKEMQPEDVLRLKPRPMYIQYQ